MKQKHIGIMTTGGDCSGLNTVIGRIVHGCVLRKWKVTGILDGTDGLCSATAKSISLNEKTLPIENVRLSGSILSNNDSNVTHFENASKKGILKEFNKKLKKSVQELQLDALVLVGGNGSLSLAHLYNDIYNSVSLVCIPKTIDMDIPLTEKTVGFDTAVQQLTTFCDQLLLTAKSHHRWFVVQSMGRDCGKLALYAGTAVGAEAILIPEIKFDINNLVKHIKNSGRDYGIIMVAEGVSVRGHSGKPAEIISRLLTSAGINNRVAFPEHIQRTGDTLASDRLLAAGFANLALQAIENNETNVITVLQNNEYKTVALQDFFNAGKQVKDPKIIGVKTSNSYVEPNDIILNTAIDLGIYIGELKK